MYITWNQNTCPEPALFEIEISAININSPTIIMCFPLNGILSFPVTFFTTEQVLTFVHSTYLPRPRWWRPLELIKTFPNSRITTNRTSYEVIGWHVCSAETITRVSSCSDSKVINLAGNTHWNKPKLHFAALRAVCWDCISSPSLASRLRSGALGRKNIRHERRLKTYTLRLMSQLFVKKPCCDVLGFQNLLCSEKR